MSRISNYTTKFMKELDRYFAPFMARLGENRYMLAIRNGVIASIPLILVGSIFLVIASFPISDTETLNNHLIEKNLDHLAIFLWLPYRSTMMIMGLFVVYGTCKSLADFYKLDSLQASFVGLVMYLISLVGPALNDMVLNAGAPGHTAPTVAFASFGTGSIFGGLMISMIAVEIFRVFVKYKITIKLPSQVPPAVSKSFLAFTPLMFGTIVATLIFAVWGFNVHSFLVTLFDPLQSFFAGNNIGGMFVIIILVTLLWSAGIHGVSVIGALARPFWAMARDNNVIAKGDSGNLWYNSETAEAGASILPEEFYQWFVWIGGSGATIGLIISMWIVGKSRYGKSLTRSATVPSLFNINEPVIFGFPIVLNPILIFPFILAPLTMGIVSYLAMLWGWVPLPYTLVAWTLPSPFGAFLTTGHWSAVILNIVVIAISTLIYLPFAKAYDKKMMNDELDQFSDAEREYYESLLDTSSKSMEKMTRVYQYNFYMLNDDHRAHLLELSDSERAFFIKDKKMMKAHMASFDAEVASRLEQNS